MARLIVRNRYALHGMADEHFGIAPAELQRAGCITFVPASGGALEIVGNDSNLAYHSVADAVDKIDRMLSDPLLEANLRRAVEARRMLFNEERFVAEIADLIDSFAPESPRSQVSADEVATRTPAR
jgi:glycosyltransferase involved in cell wall biosynthesis